MKMFFKLFLVAFFFLSCPYLLRKTAGDFRVAKLAIDLPCNPSWDVDQPSFNPAFFNNSYSYLAHGGQSFVFKSDDGEWTLKLFRHNRWIHPWRLFFRNEILRKKVRLPSDQKIDSLCLAAKLAYEKAPDLTGLAYVHLNTTKKGELPTVLFKDSLGRNHWLDLNRISFVIQHRARPVKEVFLEAIAANDHEKFQRLSRSFGALLNERALRGIRNLDTKVDPNFGFWKEQAIEWDFGNYRIDKEMKSEEDRRYEISKFAPKIERFLKQYPEWVAEYRAEAYR